MRTPADIEPLHPLDIEVEGGTWPVHAWIVDGRVLHALRPRRVYLSHASEPWEP